MHRSPFYSISLTAVMINLTGILVLTAAPVSTDPVTNLKSADPSVRIEAAKTLAAKETIAKEAIPALIDALDDMYYDVRTSAADALAKIGPAALPELKTALQQSDYYTPLYAARAVGQLAGSANQAEVAKYLVRNTQLPGPDQQQQLWAAWALSRINCSDPSVYADVSTAFKQCTQPDICKYLGRSVLNFGAQAEGLAANVVARMNEIPNATEMLQGFGKAAIEPILKALETAENRQAFGLIAALGSIGPDAEAAIPVLIKELQTPRDPWFGALAAKSLGEIGVFNEAVVAALTAASQSESKEIANSATEALAKKK